MARNREFDTNSPEGLREPAEAIAELLRRYPVAVFHGEMGAGKTTLIRAVAEVMGVEDTVTSPTFAIVNAYTAATGADIYHFDFYRIDDPAEAFDLGYEEYFFSGDICLVEWPEKIPGLIPEDALRITITAHPADPAGRHIVVEEPERSQE
ncbi:MAG: tRNA (adenosine(37)-N6)-threonylcarbamoyltransferase complex ATPase subunit type 1 TsaE [Rikenellaceae bacterium]|nr:tRNA (adenosine(37)-N6)-threonylcarbamoyltransferase complex ATPase subunit type 1 TsaE [Rikenellaceae bacterium]